MKKLSNLLNWLAVFVLGAVSLLHIHDSYLLAILRSVAPQVLVGCAFLFLLSIITKKKMASLCFSAAMIMVLGMIWPYITPEAHTEKAGNHAVDLKVSHFNVLMFNNKFKEVTHTALETKADILSFQEVNSVWKDHLIEALAMEYPYFKVQEQEACYGIAVFSKRPLQDTQVHYWGGVPAISALIDYQNKDVLILAVHANSPVSRTRYYARNKQLEEVRDFIAKHNMPKLLIGDLNTVPWDPVLKSFTADTGITDGRKEYIATFPSPFLNLGIPIDYIMHSNDWQCLSYESFSIKGSDHRGLVARFSFI